MPARDALESLGGWTDRFRPWVWGSPVRRFTYDTESPRSVLAIAGGKGGCGKTTTALGLAGAFARRDEDVIVLDADVDMPDLHTEARTGATPGASDVVEGLPMEDAIQHSTEYPGVHVLAAPTNSETVVSVLDMLRRRSERVLVDTPAGASRDVWRPLSVVDRSIVVTTPTRESVHDAVKSAALARTLEAPAIGSIVTRSDGSIDPSALLSCPTLAHVPSVADPSRDERVRNAYASCLSAVTKRNV